MEFSQSDIAGFAELYRSEYGVDLTEVEAREELSRLVELFRLAYMGAVPQLRRIPGAQPQSPQPVGA